MFVPQSRTYYFAESYNGEKTLTLMGYLAPNYSMIIDGKEHHTIYKNSNDEYVQVRYQVKCYNNELFFQIYYPTGQSIEILSTNADGSLILQVQIDMEGVLFNENWKLESPKHEQ